MASPSEHHPLPTLLELHVALTKLTEGADRRPRCLLAILPLLPSVFLFASRRGKTQNHELPEPFVRLCCAVCGCLCCVSAVVFRVKWQWSGSEWQQRNNVVAEWWKRRLCHGKISSSSSLSLLLLSSFILSCHVFLFLFFSFFFSCSFPFDSSLLSSFFFPFLSFRSCSSCSSCSCSSNVALSFFYFYLYRFLVLKVEFFCLTCNVCTSPLCQVPMCLQRSLRCLKQRNTLPLHGCHSQSRCACWSLEELDLWDHTSWIDSC